MLGFLKINSIGGRLALALVLLAVLAVAITTVANVMVARDMTERAFDQRLSSLRSQLVDEIAAEAHRALSMANTVAGNTAAQEAFAAQDRDQLAQYYVSGFDHLKKAEDVRQFQFHLPPATSFLRVHKPEKFGDDLSSFRHTVVKVNETRQPISGLERGVAGLGMRGVVPVFHAGAHIGSVEFGLSFGQPFFDRFTERSGAKAALYVLRDSAIEKFSSTFPESQVFEDGMLRSAAGAAEPTVLPTVAVDDVAHAVMLTPITDFSGAVIGVAAIGFDRSALDSAVTTGNLISLGIGIAVLLLALAVAAILNRSIARPVAKLTAVMRDLASGDTGVDIPGRDRQDELGAMADAVQVFKDSAIEKTRLEAEQAENERRAEEEKKRAMREMADRFDQEVGSIVNMVQSAASELLNTSGQLNAAVEQSESQTEVASGGADQASQSVQTVAAAAEELSAAVQEVNGQINACAHRLQSAVDSARDAETLMEDLAKAVAQIDEVVTQISDVAEQTNLLALNATIESARAGEAGKGFAVVANEVKSLATATRTMTDNIVAQLNSVKQASAKAVESTRGIVANVNEISGTTTAIAGAIEEQTSSTVEISRSAQEAAGGTHAVTESLGTVRDAAGRTASASGSVGNAANQLADQADALRSAVNTFLNQVRSSQT
ncbi:methyl-accepting chemotaxis protein [Hwanghaeella sp.]|uniref:methyl-accepting chemotaxis protein n=1 Tax=Hwanghaeella sp. TaxID=2605943 RepID=UPI003CCBEF1C